MHAKRIVAVAACVALTSLTAAVATTRHHPMRGAVSPRLRGAAEELRTALSGVGARWRELRAGVAGIALCEARVKVVAVPSGAALRPPARGAMEFGYAQTIPLCAIARGPDLSTWAFSATVSVTLALDFTIDLTVRAVRRSRS